MTSTLFSSTRTVTRTRSRKYIAMHAEIILRSISVREDGIEVSHSSGVSKMVRKRLRSTELKATGG